VVLPKDILILLLTSDHWLLTLHRRTFIWCRSSASNFHYTTSRRACQEPLPVSLLPGMHGMAYGRTGATQDEGEVGHGEQSPLLIGLLAEASYPLGKQGSGPGAIGQLLDLLFVPLR
jgi:hypothetical protein